MLLEWIRGWLTPHPFWIRDLGKKGEFLVRRYYRRRGCHLVARNWRHGRGEIDAIMANPFGFVFVEVKTRTWREGLRMADALSFEQEKRLNGLAHYYMSKWDKPHPWRFELHLVTVRGGRWTMEHMRI